MKCPVVLPAFLALFIALAYGGAAQAEPQAPYSLQECFELALRSSEALKISVEEVHIAEAQYREAIAALYPSLDLLAAQRLRDNAQFGRITRSNSSQEDAAGPTGGSGGTLGRSQAEAYLSARQPLFRGFRDYLLLQAAQIEVRAREYEEVRARELLYQDVAELFYQIQAGSARIAVLEAGQLTLKQRLRELAEFERLGKARESEKLAAEADLADLKAVRERAAGAVAAARELLAFVVDLPAADLELEQSAALTPLSELNHYLERGRGRADLAAAKARVESANKSSKAAERERWPSIDLGASAYPLEDPDRNREWELGVELSLPVFDGGAISAREAQERARFNQANFYLQQNSRRIERDIRVAFADARAALAELKSLDALLSATRRSSEVQRRDYTLGIVTNLDVLQAIRKQQEAEIRREDLRFSYLGALARLEVAAGGVVK